jgi:hypothetical protein
MIIRDIPQSGKFGNAVSLKSRYGQSRRPLVLPTDTRTPAQLRVRSTLGRVASRWRALTDAQRAAWTAAARDVASRRRLGQSGPLTGFLLFTKINCALAAIGLQQVVDPPQRPNFNANPVGPLTITNTDGVIDLKLSVPGTPAQQIVVLGYPPCSAGVSFARDFTILGLLPPPVAGFSTITDFYRAKYGVPPIGTRVFIRTRQH